MVIEVGRTGIWPEGFYLSSGKREESGVIFSGSGVIGGVIVRTNGLNDIVINLYDNTIGMGDVLLDILIPGTDKIGGVFFGAIPVRSFLGCFLSISGIGGSCIVYYRN